ncbi:MAG: response regulator [Robiginitomaculum sp.]|nr:response regulator [Robiginitomaculum sp.]
MTTKIIGTEQTANSQDLPVETLRLLVKSINLSNSPLMLYGENYEIIFANPAARSFWPDLINGLEKGEGIKIAIEKQIRTLLPHLPDEQINEAVASTLRCYETNKPFELFATKNRQCRVTLRAIGNFMIGLGVDITDLKKRESELKKARKAEENSSLAKSEFLANMSHEIRTPMNGIMGMAQILAEGNLNRREKDMVKVIERSGEALLTVINDILDFSKIEAGKIVLDQAPFLLRETIEDVTSLLSSAAANTGIDLLLRMQPDLPTRYLGDVGRIRQIMTNLVGNAVKFTHKGHVLIDVKGEVVADNANLTIEVSDTGIGIPEDKLAHIFDKFSQVDGSTTREYEGTGLGLSIAVNLVKLMGGAITAKSKVGEGSIFSIKLVLPLAANLAEMKTSSTKIAGTNILVIDDNLINREILKEQMQFWKCHCIAVESGQLGLAVLEKAKQKNIEIDLVIVDYQMPVMTGEAFIRNLKTRPEFRSLPTVMLSSVDESALQRRLSGLGINRFLTKPTRSSALLDAISDAITQARALNNRAVKTKMKKHILKNRERTEKRVQEGIQADRAPAVQERLGGARQFVLDIHSQPKNIEQDSTKQENRLDVLIAEDNDVNQIYISYIMQDMGLTYKIVPNGRVAVDKWQALAPKLVLMDISMPEMNGYEATNAIRALEEKTGRARTPIIAVTAHTLSGDRARCLENDMDDYISKPLSISALTEKLEKWGISQTQGARMQVG